MNAALGIAAVLGTLGVLFAVARRARSRGFLSPESSRKLVHVGMGIVCLAFPWLFATVAPVLVLAALASVAMLAARAVPALRRRFGCVLGDVERRSYGEFAFVAGITVAFALAQGRPIFYLPAVAVLTFGDALAALVGTRFGLHRFRTPGGSKSLEGSLAFLAVAIPCVAIPLAAAGRPEALLAGSAGGVLLALAEASTWYGFDNFAIPVAGAALVRAFAIGLNGGLPS